MNKRKIRVAIADDHVLFAEGLASFINTSSDIKVCNISKNGNELIKYLDNNSFPDVILLDIEMPGKDGFATVKEILDKYKDAQIIILSMYNVRVYIKKMLEAGVSGYLLKDTAGNKLLDSIRKVADGGLAFYEQALDLMKLMISDNEGYNLDMMLFTNRELKVIKYLCEEKSITEISKILNVSKSTIEGDRRNIAKKIEVKSTAGIVVYAVKNKLNQI